MIKFKITGKDFKINGSIPQSWYEVTFRQYLKYLQCKDDLLQVVSLLSGVNYEIFNKGKIAGLEDIIRALLFVKKPPEFGDVTPNIGKYKLPINGKKKFDIQFESLGQFEDMRKIMMSVPENDLMAHISAYPKYCGIYLQVIRDEQYDYNRAMDMEEEILDMPMHEVMVCGAFFFLKLRILSTGIEINSQNTIRNPKKSRQGSINSKRSSATTRR